MERCAREAVRGGETRLAYLQRSPLFREPQARVRELAQQMDDTAEQLARLVADRLADQRRRLEAARSSLREHRPDHVLRMRQQELQTLRERLLRGGSQRLDALRGRLEHAGNLLRVLGPQSTLARGYSITRTAAGEIVRSVAQAPPGTPLRTQVADGEVRSRVEQ